MRTGLDAVGGIHCMPNELSITLSSLKVRHEPLLFISAFHSFSLSLYPWTSGDVHALSQVPRSTFGRLMRLSPL